MSAVARTQEHGVAILGCCLMSNHIHVVAIPKRADSLARAIGQTDGRYSQWFNRRYRRIGHLWQVRFKFFALGRSHLVAALAYVDLNPVRITLESDPLLDPWAGSRAAFVCPDCEKRSRFLYRLENGTFSCNQHVSKVRVKLEAALSKLKKVNRMQRNHKYRAAGQRLERDANDELAALWDLDGLLSWARREIRTGKRARATPKTGSSAR